MVKDLGLAMQNLRVRLQSGQLSTNILRVLVT